MRRDAPYPSLSIARKRAVFALRAEFLFLSFSKEKGTKKKGNLRAAPLKIPLIVQSWYAQSKTLCFPFSQLQVALRAMKLYEAGKTKRICNDITPSAHEPSPRYTVTFGQVGKVARRSRDGCNTLLREVWQHFICDEMLPCAREAGEP